MSLLADQPGLPPGHPGAASAGLSAQRFVVGAALATGAIAFVNLMHFSQGWVQFGYRFSNDFAPFAHGPGRRWRWRASAVRWCGRGAGRRVGAGQRVGRLLGRDARMVSGSPRRSRAADAGAAPPAGAAPADRCPGARRGWRCPRPSSSSSRCALDVRTLLPDVALWDTGEFQAIGPVLGIAHPTGYPTYTLLAWLASVVLQPFGNEAYRANLLSAILISGAAALTGVAGRAARRDGPCWGSPRASPLAVTPARLAHRAPGAIPTRCTSSSRRSCWCCWSAGCSASGAGAPGAGRWLLAGVHRLRAVARQPRPDAAAGAGHRRLRARWSRRRILWRRWRLVLACARGAGADDGRCVCLHPAPRGHEPAARLRRSRRRGTSFRYLVLGEQFRGTFHAAAVAGRRRPTIVWQELAGQPRAGAAWLALAGAVLGALRHGASSCSPALWFVLHLRLRPRVRERGHRALLPGADHARGGLGRAGNRRGLDRARGAVAPLRRAAAGARSRGDARLRCDRLALALAALILLVPILLPVPERAAEAWTSPATAARTSGWRRRSPRLPPNAVIVSWWSYSTPLWYGHFVEGDPARRHDHRRPHHHRRWLRQRPERHRHVPGQAARLPDPPGSRPSAVLRSATASGSCPDFRRSPTCTGWCRRALPDRHVYDPAVPQNAGPEAAPQSSLPDDRVAELSYFFPAHNEAENIEPLVNEALEVLPTLAHRFEIIAVDDGSRDGTGELADRLAAQHPDLVRVVHHGTNQGYGAALRSGFGASRYAWVAFTDGDRQFRLADLGRPAQASRTARLRAGARPARRGRGLPPHARRPCDPPRLRARLPLLPAPAASASRFATSTAPASCSAASRSTVCASSRAAPSSRPSCSSS